MSSNTTSEHSPATSVAALRWAVVGAGSIGCRHLRNLHALGANGLMAIRRQPTGLEQDLSCVTVSTRLQAAHDDRSAAIICTPSVRHTDDAVAAIEAGYHVLVEKPLATTLPGARAIREAADAHGRIVMVASCLRFHPVLVRLRHLVSSGVLGDAHWLSVWCGQHLAEWRPSREFRDVYSARRDDGGGVLLDLIHEIDYLHWIWGAVRLTAAIIGTGARLAVDVEETADLMLTLPGGAAVTCHLDYLSRPATRGGRLAAAHGSARWDLLAPSLEVWTAEEGWLPERMPPGWTPNRMYSDELIACAGCILHGAANPSPVADGARALAVALEAGERGAAAG